MFRRSPWRILGLWSWGYWAGGVGVSVYCRTPAPIAPRASLDRCIGVLPQSRAVRSQCPLDRCIGVSVYYRSPAPIAPRAPLDRCIGVSVYYRNPAPIAPRTSLDRCMVYRGNPAPIAHGAPLGRCIGVSVHGKGGSVYRCIGVFQFSCPLLRSHCNIRPFPCGDYTMLSPSGTMTRT